MAGKGLEFEAGNDFGASAMDSIKDAISQPASEPTPTPESTEVTPEVKPEVIPNPEDSTRTDWADPDPNATEATKTDEVADPVDEGTFFELKGADGNTRKIRLDPTDSDLKELLGKGSAADKWRLERDRARRELKALQDERKRLEAAAEKAKVWDELEEFNSLGQFDAIAKTTLGDNYEAFIAEQRARWEAEHSGSPEQIAEIEERERERASKLAEYRYQKKLKELEDRIAADEERSYLTKFQAAGSAALQKHDFNKYVDDPHRADALNEKVWEAAVSDIQRYAEKRKLEPNQITEQMIHKAVAQNAKLIRGGQAKAAEAAADAVIEKKTKDAERNAQIVATERYPSGGKLPNDILSGWDGKSMTALMKRLRRG